MGNPHHITAGHLTLRPSPSRRQADGKPCAAEVLTTLGLRKTGQDKVWYIPRQPDVTRIAYRLERANRAQAGWKKS